MFRITRFPRRVKKSTRLLSEPVQIPVPPGRFVPPADPLWKCFPKSLYLGKNSHSSFQFHKWTHAQIDKTIVEIPIRVSGIPNRSYITDLPSLRKIDVSMVRKGVLLRNFPISALISTISRGNGYIKYLFSTFG